MQGKEEVTFIAFNNLLGTLGVMGKCIYCHTVCRHHLFVLMGGTKGNPGNGHGKTNGGTPWQKNKHGIPVVAVCTHVFISIVLTVTGSFKKVLLYAGFVLQLIASFAVASSLFIKNKRQLRFVAL